MGFIKVKSPTEKSRMISICTGRAAFGVSEVERRGSVAVARETLICTPFRNSGNKQRVLNPFENAVLHNVKRCRVILR